MRRCNCGVGTGGQGKRKAPDAGGKGTSSIVTRLIGPLEEGNETDDRQLFTVILDVAGFALDAVAGRATGESDPGLGCTSDLPVMPGANTGASLIGGALLFTICL